MFEEGRLFIPPPPRLVLGEGCGEPWAAGLRPKAGRVLGAGLPCLINHEREKKKKNEKKKLEFRSKKTKNLMLITCKPSDWSSIPSQQSFLHQLHFPGYPHSNYSRPLSPSSERPVDSQMMGKEVDSWKKKIPPRKKNPVEEDYSKLVE
jgi:hypothetical protein